MWKENRTSSLRIAGFLRAVTCLAILAFLPGANSPPVPPVSPPASSLLNSYSDATYGFTTATPAFAEAKQERNVVAIFQAPPEDGFSANVTILVDPIKTTRKEYVQASITTMETTNPRAAIRRLVEKQVSGKDAEVLDYDANMGGRRLRFLQLLVVGEERVYVMTCTAPVDSFAKYEAQFRKCIESFRLDK
jgi:hypothetical protein